MPTTLILLVLLALPAAAQIGVTLQVNNPTPTIGGGTFDFTIVLTNQSSLPQFLQFTDPLPPGLVFAGLTLSSQNGATANCNSPASGKNGPVVCTNPAFPAGGVLTLVLTCRVPSNLSPGVRTNQVFALPSQPGQSIPSTASAAVSLITDANITAFTQTATATVRRGGLINYNISVTNSGSSDGINVLVRDSLPAYVAVQSISSTGGFKNNCAYRPDTRVLTCTAPNLPSGASEISIAVRASNENRMPASLLATATLQASQFTILSGPTTAPASTTVIR